MIARVERREELFHPADAPGPRRDKKRYAKQVHKLRVGRSTLLEILKELELAPEAQKDENMF